LGERNIYVGRGSCWGIKEGVWASGSGVSASNVGDIIALLMYDLKRGYTYDHSCRVIPMDIRLFAQRLNYLIPLARKHYGRGEEERVRQIVEYVKRTQRLPPGVPIRLQGDRSKVNRVLSRIGVLERVPAVVRARH